MVGNYAPEKSGKVLNYEMTHHRKWRRCLLS